MTHTYSITGMTCSSCTAKVKNELLKLGDITEAQVSLAAPQATIVMQKHVPLSTLQEAISRAGSYTIAASGAPDLTESAGAAGNTASYYPVFLIFGFIAGAAALAQSGTGSFSFMLWMRHFMAGFFLVFSFFKLLNLKGFAEGYRTYDLLAGKLPVYGLIYPFLELGLGIAYLTDFMPQATSLFALLLMSISTVGVAASLLQRKSFQCACLGTIIKLPLSKVTLFEDILMVAMSATMLAMIS